jgi:hypothetical protein
VPLVVLYFATREQRAMQDLTPAARMRWVVLGPPSWAMSGFGGVLVSSGLSAGWPKACGSRVRALDGLLVLFGGWVLHYAPFFLFGRQLFLHHYLPALVFGVGLLAALVDHLCGRLVAGPATCIAMSAIWLYGVLAPLSLGTALTPAQIAARQLRSTWDLAGGAS